MRWMALAGLALALLVAAGGETEAQTSCAGWNATCQARCRDAGNPECANYCTRQVTACRRTGCWTEGQRFGGRQHCNLSR
ncbi:hypothetical protein E8L99_01875 [Phreatobacter aquaticus]|uniref:Uncharacterized protein n=1 Tax=Phreatobacter aquaticus TaxID=2570229 RepID=A0A4D7QDT3_9HYPH|nr:hypothetical protein [Phreatobacter aquaticus]QCK84621.1 hypothetical protein E8L99_01875 [Phreatobacter aquaticus]